MTLRIQTRLTAIGSGKGGTGKTFVSVGLARALSREGEHILLFDADIGLANTAVQLGLASGGDFDAVLRSGRIAREHVAAVGGGIGIRGGFDLLAPPSGSGAFVDLPVAAAHRLVTALRAADRYDRIILDLAAGIDGATITFAAAADESLIVMTPDPASLTDAYAFVKLVLRRGGRVPASLVNMVTGEAEARRVSDSLARTCLAFLKHAPDAAGAIPRDLRAAESVKRQAEVLSTQPQAPSSRALCEIARRLHTANRPAVALAGGVR